MKFFFTFFIDSGLSFFIKISINSPDDEATDIFSSINSSFFISFINSAFKNLIEILINKNKFFLFHLNLIVLK